ncbi:MAG: ABC transporter permease [Chloroflexi bacterium]|nr:MAG: ABC transporter permease [Chloroflexota bacterium]
MTDIPRQLPADGAVPRPVAPIARSGEHAGPRSTLLRQIARDPWMMVGLAIVVVIGALAILAPFLPLPDPDATEPARRLAAPGELGYPLGSDQLGRDILSRIVWGGRVSLIIGFVSAGLALVLGGALGLVSGYFGGVADNLVMRVVDTLMAFPYVLLAILLVAMLGPGLVNAMIAVAIANVSFYARGVRSAVLLTRGQEYVEASRAIGATSFHIIARQIVPNVLPTALVAASLNVGWMITETAGLSFIGLGAQPPTADWGTMLADGRAVITVAYHVGTLPGIAILALVIGTNLIGEGLRDALDPRFRG